MDLKKFRHNKKGQAAFKAIPAILLSLLLVAMFGVVNVLTTTEFTSSVSGITNTNNNQSVTFAASSAQLATNGRSYSVSSVNNFTNNTIGSNNYAVNGTFGDISLLAGASQASGQGTSPTINVSYTHVTDSNTQQILQNSTVGTRKIFEQFGTIGTVVGVMLILVVVLYFLGRKKGSMSAV